MSSNLYFGQEFLHKTEKPKSNKGKKDGPCNCGCSCCMPISDEMKITRPGTVTAIRRTNVEWEGTGELRVDEKGYFIALIEVTDHFTHTDQHGEETRFMKSVNIKRVRIHRDCDLVANLKYPVPFEKSSLGTQIPDVSPYHRRVVIKEHSCPPEDYQLPPKTLAIARRYSGWEIDSNRERRYFNRDLSDVLELFDMARTPATVVESGHNPPPYDEAVRRRP